MPKHLVTMLVGRIVEAETPEQANRMASMPFLLDAVPGVVAVSLTGTRLATEDDENGDIHQRIQAIQPAETTDAV